MTSTMNDLNIPGPEVFKAAMKKLAVSAIYTDEAFARFKNTLDLIVKEYGDQFPGLKPFQSEWNGYTSFLNKYIITSRDVATETAAEYEDYSVILKLFDSLKTKEDIERLVIELKKFASRKPVHTPVDLKDRLLVLKREVDNFQQRFDKYLDEQGVRLPDLAKVLRQEIETVEAEVQALNTQIADILLGLQFALWWLLVGPPVQGTALAIFFIKRAEKENQFDELRAQLKQLEPLEKPLPEILIQLAGLVPAFNIFTEYLVVFVDIWSEFHNEALSFATELEKVSSPTELPESLKARVKLAQEVSIPLREGLKEYATTIRG